MQIAQRFVDRFIRLILIAEMGDARFVACHFVFSDTSLSVYSVLKYGWFLSVAQKNFGLLFRRAKIPMRQPQSVPEP